MAADDRDPDAPSLEPPSLGLFRRRRRKPEPAPEETPEAASPSPPEAVGPQHPEPEPAAPAEPGPPAEPEQAPTEAVEPVAPEPGAGQDRSAEQPTTVLPRTASTAPPLFADEADLADAAGGGDETSLLPSAATDEEAPPRESARARRPRRPRRSTPLLTGVAAVLVTGLLVGLGTVGLTAGGLQACEATRGTSSCGGSGMALLLVILAAMVLLGGWLLRACHIPDPGSTSFLAVGLLAVVALVFLIDHLLEWWMVIVIPLVSVATYALSHWVTVSVIEPARE